MAANTRKIIWAVDPFAEDLKLQQATARALKAFVADDHPAEIFPVYVQEPLPAFVVDYYGTATPTRANPEEFQKTIQAEAQSRLEGIVRKVELTHLMPVQVIVAAKPSLQSAVGRLLERARELKADTIALSTRAYGGPARWILGSFAEALSLSSEIPLLVVNPSWSGRANFKEILFATDFSAESQEAFRKVIALAKTQGATIQLFHKIKYDLTPAVEVAFLTYSRYKEIYAYEVRAKEAEAKRWVDEAQAAGVPAEFEVDSKLGSGTVETAILQRAKGRGCMIALASHSGLAWRTFMGSTTRKVLRAAIVPVWVIHPAAKPARKSSTDELFELSEDEVMNDLNLARRA